MLLNNMYLVSEKNQLLELFRVVFFSGMYVVIGDQSEACYSVFLIYFNLFNFNHHQRYKINNFSTFLAT